MALILHKSFPTGIELDCYCKIVNLTGTKNGVAVVISAYKNQAASEDGLAPLDSEEYHFTPDVNENSIRWDKQAYEHLKSLPTFVGAVDA